MSKPARAPKLRWIALGALAVFGLYHLAGPASSSSASSLSSTASLDLVDTAPFPDEVWAHAKDPETNVEVLGVGRHSATIIFIQLSDPPPSSGLSSPPRTAC